MGYLGSELFKERGNTYNLRSQVKNATRQSHTLKNDMGTMSDMSAANKFEVLLLRKQNQQLRAKIEEQSQKLSERKSEIQSLGVSSMADAAALTLEMENMSTSHQEEIEKLQIQREEEEKKCCSEKQILRKEIEELEEKHAIEIENMNVELEKMKEDHEVDISRMLDALETTQNLSSKVSHMDEREINDAQEKYETKTQNTKDDSMMLDALETSHNLSSKVSHTDEREVNDVRERNEAKTQNSKDDVHDSISREANQKSTKACCSQM